jgi:hypothetical protein
MKTIILVILMTKYALFGQELKLGDTGNTIVFKYSPKETYLQLQQGNKNEIIWKKPFFIGSKPDDVMFNSTVYPTVENKIYNPYKGGKIIHADFKELENGTSICLVLLELDYHFGHYYGSWIGPLPPYEYADRPQVYFRELLGKKNYLLRSFIKNNGEWKPYLSCYLDSIWYDLIRIPIQEIHIKNTNNYSVTYQHSRKLLKYNTSMDFSMKVKNEGLTLEDYEPLAPGAEPKRREILFDSKEPVTKELVYNDKIGFLQIRDAGKLKYPVKAVWWHGFDEFEFKSLAQKTADKNNRYLREEDKLRIDVSKELSYSEIVKEQKSRLPKNAEIYEPDLLPMPDDYMQLMFDIVKFRKYEDRRPFTKEEKIRLLNFRIKDKNSESYKKELEAMLSEKNLSSSMFFYEE